MALKVYNVCILLKITVKNICVHDYNFCSSDKNYSYLSNKFKVRNFHLYVRNARSDWKYLMAFLITNDGIFAIVCAGQNRFYGLESMHDYCIFKIEFFPTIYYIKRNLVFKNVFTLLHIAIPRRAKTDIHYQCKNKLNAGRSFNKNMEYYISKNT